DAAISPHTARGSGSAGAQGGRARHAASFGGAGSEGREAAAGERADQGRDGRGAGADQGPARGAEAGEPAGKLQREGATRERGRAATLTRIGRPAVRALISALQAGPGSSKVYYASRALRFIGQPAVPALTQALHAPDPAVARWSARLLGDMGDTAALPALRLA